MQVLIINPILYTSETKNIKKIHSIKDTMIYDLCLAFKEEGHKVVLYAGEQYKPTCDEQYPFEIVWGKCFFEKIFSPHRFPVLSDLSGYIKKNLNSFDLIITSEVFSKNSLTAYRLAKKKTLIWHELAIHNRMLKKIPSKIWYNIVVPLFMRNAFVIARSTDAKKFIKKYCKNVSDHVIDHGVNLSKFEFFGKKENYFVVCAQLIDRKKIDGIIEKFSLYLQKCDDTAKLYIIGEGELESSLKQQTKELNIADNVVFTGKMNHQDLMPILAKASALLVNTIKDNSMISIVEAIAVGTPVVTTTVPLNSEYIIKHKLGIAKPIWDENDLKEIRENNDFYVKNCFEYRERLSTKFRVSQFIDASNN